MENGKAVVLPVVLKGGNNYLLWARTAKAVLCGRGLWSHIESSAPNHKEEKDEAVVLAAETKWFQEDQAVLAIIQGSLDMPVLEAYSYCEKAKELWDTLKNVFGNISNLTRVFEVKREINNLSQEDTEFNTFFGKFRALWAEYEMLRPASMDADVLNERREQDKVFALLMVLNPAYNDLIKFILRSDKLPCLEDVCSQIQKEQGALGLFGGKGGELIMAYKAEQAAANKSNYKSGERSNIICDHCKLKGHTKDKCYFLHPHLRPSTSKWKEWKDKKAAKAQMATSSSNRPQEEDGAAMTASSEFVKKADLDALIKALKDSGNPIHAFSFHALSNHIANQALNCQTISSSKPLIVDSGASHHMISDSKLISNIRPATGDVIIANGDRIPVKGIGNLRLFDKNSKALYMPSFTSNLLSVKRTNTTLPTNLTLKVVGTGYAFNLRLLATVKVMWK